MSRSSPKKSPNNRPADTSYVRQHKHALSCSHNYNNYRLYYINASVCIAVGIPIFESLPADLTRISNGTNIPISLAKKFYY